MQMSKPMRGSAAWMLCALLGCASGGGAKSESTAAPDADVASLQTFAVQAPGEAPLSIADARIRDAIRAELGEKGYREVAQAPDLLVSFEATEAIAEVHKESPVRIGVGMGSWGGPVGVGVGTSAPVGRGSVESVAKTRLTIRAVDPTQNREVWLGEATREMDASFDSSKIEQLVEAALSDFPKHRP
jgi:hypothetical protein